MKMFGIFPQTINPDEANKPLFRGFDDMFNMPQSRHTEVKSEDIRANKELTVLAESPQSGVGIAIARNGREIFCTGHLEYNPDTLDTEYKRDMGKRDDVAMPVNYYIDNDPEKGPKVTWRAHANLFYHNCSAESFRTWRKTFETAVPIQKISTYWASAATYWLQQVTDPDNCGAVSQFVPDSYYDSKGWTQAYHDFDWYEAAGFDQTGW